MLYKKYLSVTHSGNANNAIRFSLSFNRDTFHWATGQSKQKGYQLTATPVERQVDTDGRVVQESFTAFTGFYKIILAAERQSPKRLQEAISILEQELQSYMDHFEGEGYVFDKY